MAGTPWTPERDRAMKGFSADPLGQGLWAAGLEFAAVQEFRCQLYTIEPEVKVEGDRIYVGARFQLRLSNGRRVGSHLTILNGPTCLSSQRQLSPELAALWKTRLVAALEMLFELGDGPTIADQRVCRTSVLSQSPLGVQRPQAYGDLAWRTSKGRHLTLAEHQ